MKAIQVLVRLVIQAMLTVVFLNALVIILGWAFGPWMAHWTMAGLRFALSMFVWLLPFAALTMALMLLIPMPTLEQ